MKNSNFKVMIASSGILSLMGCGPMKDFKEMHDSTMQMNSTTSEMNKTTAKMADTTLHMAENMTEMLKQTKEMASQMTVMSQGLKDMRTDMQTMSKQMNALPEMNANMIKMTGKMDVLTEMNANMNALRGDIATMTKRMDVLTTMNDNMTALRGDMAGMSGKMDVLKPMNDNMTALRGDMVGMTAKMDVLKTMNENMTSLRGDMAAMTKKMDVLKTMNDNMTALRGDMGNMTTKMDVLTEMNTNMKDLRGDIASMTTKMNVLAEMNTNMKDLRGDISGMAKQMNGVNDNIVIMANQMSGLSGDIKKMGTTMGLMNSNLRLVFTGEHRISTLKAMEAASDLTTKMGYAAEYMISQTYQAWNSQTDTPQARLDLMGLATPDFFFKMSNYIRDRDMVDPSKTDATSLNLYSIAAALDYINVIQMDGIKGTDQKPVTILSMIEDGLRARADVNSGKVKLADLPIYQREVLNHEHDAIYLLRVRHNFMKGVAFTIASLGDNGNPQSKSSSVMDFLKARVLNKTWDAKLDTKAVSQIELIATALDAAAETEKFLGDIGINPMPYKNLTVLLQSMNTTALQNKASTPEIEHFNRSMNQMIELSKRSY